MAHNAETELRLDELCRVMRALKWKRGESGPVYAKKWGLSEDRVKDLAAEAWKRVCEEATDKDRITVKVSVMLEQVLDDAMRETEDPATIDDGGKRGAYKESPNGARRVVVEAAKTWAAIVGASAPQRHEVAVGGPSFADARRIMREAFGDVAPVTTDAETPKEK